MSSSYATVWAKRSLNPNRRHRNVEKHLKHFGFTPYPLPVKVPTAKQRVAALNLKLKKIRSRRKHLKKLKNKTSK